MTGNLTQPEMLTYREGQKRHVTTRQHKRYIMVTHLSKRHLTACATTGHILDHIDDMYGYNEICKSETVPQHSNFAKLDQINNWNYLPQKLLFSFGISMRYCCKCKWGTYEMLML